MEHEERRQRWRATIGTNIRRAREARGLSLKSLATKSGVTLQYLGRVELGEVDVSVAVLAQVARGLGVHAAQLMANVDAETENTDPGELQARASRLLERMDEPTLKIAVSMLGVLTEELIGPEASPEVPGRKRRGRPRANPQPQQDGEDADRS